MKEFKIPCAVLSSELDKEKAKKLHDKFIELGAVYCEDFECYNDWKYCGIDYEKDTIKFDNLAYYSRDDLVDEVALYTYEEVMAFGNQEDTVQDCVDEYVPVNAAELLSEAVEAHESVKLSLKEKSVSDSVVGATGGVDEFTASKEYTIYQKGSVIFKGDKEYLTKLRDVINEVLNND